MARPLDGWERCAQFLPYRLEKTARLICSPLYEDGLGWRVLVSF